ncbi:MAG: hypothetical protein KatS3mg114_1204 [Planctomycetaceae bacterium]|nr:MAG: hypothetical protein KatS3mg114_1204 [Planctomycetaceae bacterium]
MDALLVTCCLWGWLAQTAPPYRTANFVVYAPTPEFAQQVGQAAEWYRRELALIWLGYEMPRWSAPCPIRMQVGSVGAGGATTFQFDRGEVFGWSMKIQGSAERILDSVLPHEINHTVFASHFRCPLPRWADEGAASLIEHDAERYRLRSIHRQSLEQRQLIPLSKLLTIKQYPQDERGVLLLYAQGHSVADYLVQHGGPRQFVAFLETALKSGWEEAFARHYACQDLQRLEQQVVAWVAADFPALEGATSLLADSRAPEVVIRGQSAPLRPDLGEPAPFPTDWLTAGAPRPRSRAPLVLPIEQRWDDTLARSRTTLLAP